MANEVSKLIDGTITTVEFDNHITEVGPYAFAYSALSSVVFSNTITIINLSAFYYCTGLTSVTIPGNVLDIGISAFAYCTNLSSLTLQNGITRIYENAFNNCTSLTSLTIPDSVTHIGNSFRNCTSLTTVTIGTGFNQAGGASEDCLFAGCTSLTSVTINATTPPDGIYLVGMMKDNSCNVYVPSESVSAYKNTISFSSIQYRNRVLAIPE